MKIFLRKIPKSDDDSVNLDRAGVVISLIRKGHSIKCKHCKSMIEDIDTELEKEHFNSYLNKERILTISKKPSK